MLVARSVLLGAAASAGWRGQHGLHDGHSGAKHITLHARDHTRSRTRTPRRATNALVALSGPLSIEAAPHFARQSSELLADSPRRKHSAGSSAERDALTASGNTVCCKQAAADVGSTAAAALAAAMSSSWQRAASGKRGDSARASAAGDGAAAAANVGLPCRAGFEIAVQIGGQESHNHLSDPSVREHVRRLTSTMQVRAPNCARKRSTPLSPQRHTAACTGRSVQRDQRPAPHQLRNAPRVHLWRAFHPTDALTPLWRVAPCRRRRRPCLPRQP